MEYTKLGNSGLKLSKLTLGTMTFGQQADKTTSFEILDKAFAAGITSIDTANAYPIGRESYAQAGQTETILGEWMQSKRDQIVLTTKVFAQMGPGPNDSGLSRKHILHSIEGSLKRLQTDYIDIYMAHQYDFNTPLEETMRAFDELVRAGKVHYIGVSNWRAWQIAKANGIADKLGLHRISVVEPRYNLLFRMIEDDLIPMCKEEGIGILPYNPLAGGLLTGKHQKDKTPDANERFGLNSAGALYQKRYWQDANFNAVDQFITWCMEQKLDPITTAVKWTMQQSGITSVIIGASKASQLDSSLAAVSMPDLTTEQLAWLDQLWFSLPRRFEFN